MYGKPTAPIRALAKKAHLDTLFTCALCVGFWVGLVYTIVFGKEIFYPLAVSAFKVSNDHYDNNAHEGASPILIFHFS
jgi:hypothetical protein